MRKVYRPPATPCQRVIDCLTIPEATKENLQSMVGKLDPLRLLEEIRVMQDHIARIAQGETLPIPPHRDADLDQFLKSLSTA